MQLYSYNSVTKNNVLCKFNIPCYLEWCVERMKETSFCFSSTVVRVIHVRKIKITERWWRMRRKINLDKVWCKHVKHRFLTFPGIKTRKNVDTLQIHRFCALTDYFALNPKESVTSWSLSPQLLRVQMEKTTSRYWELQRIYWISSRWQLKRRDPPAHCWGEGLTISHRINSACYNKHYEPLDSSFEWKMKMRFGLK